MVNKFDFMLREAKVRQLLADNHLDVTTGARRLGVSRCHFSQLLNGGRRLSPRVRRLLLERSPFRDLAEDMLWERVSAAPCSDLTPDAAANNRKLT